MKPQPGDLLVVRSPGIAGRLIRFGAALLDKPNLSNHVAIVHHYDKAGVLWVIEGRPGGVGWRQADDYLKSPWTVNNSGQYKTQPQRDMITAGAVALLGTPYDWAAIADDAVDSLHLADLWKPQFGTVPGQVVCSSLAAWLYAKAALDHPSGGRNVSPGDWDELIQLKHYSL
jgi:hypothetical protein